MTTVISVRFPTSGRVYYFDPGDNELKDGDAVIVETARGMEFGEIAQLPHEVADELVIQPLKPIVRIATDEDRKMRQEYSAKEAEAFDICKKKIEKHHLDMKLVGVEYAFDGSKVVFFFTADERVDFRELVRDLAGEFRTRIELRQIGVRDEAKLLGGLGPCGRPVCCNSFLDMFRPVSIKMAKEQNLSLSPTKISGLCGRLMCCLQYEEAAYEDTKKKMPRVGKDIQTPDGIGHVIENNAITEKTKVKLAMEDGTIEIREYHYSVLGKPGEIIKEEAPAPVADEPKNMEVLSQPEVSAAEAPQDGEYSGQKRKRPPRRRSGKHRSPDNKKTEEKTDTESGKNFQGKKGNGSDNKNVAEPEASLSQKAQFSKNARFNRRRGRGGQKRGKPQNSAKPQE